MPSEPQRLQKLLAAAGVASRRAVDEAIAAGKVTVNGKLARLGQRATLQDDIRIDGRKVTLDPDLRYLMLNKPEGFISSASDPQGRRGAADLLGEEGRLFSVGRLDAATEGLLLFTNDGELAHRITHPSYGLHKTYLAEVGGRVSQKTISTLMKQGVKIDRGRPAKADSAKIVSRTGDRTLVEIVVHEGRKHVVRKMLQEVGHPVLRLVRTAVGPVRLGKLASGTYRKLSPDEVAALYEAVGL